jgi:hypothetical protein
MKQRISLGDPHEVFFTRQVVLMMIDQKRRAWSATTERRPPTIPCHPSIPSGRTPPVRHPTSSSPPVALRCQGLHPTHEEILESLNSHILSEDGRNDVLRYLLEDVMNPTHHLRHEDSPPRRTRADGICGLRGCWCVASHWIPGASTLSHLLSMISTL